MPNEIAFRREPIPSLDRLESEWRSLEAVARPSFFTSWHWVGTLLASLPETHRPDLLRGSTSHATVALALLGSAVTRRRKGLIRSRGLHINATGDRRFDSIVIEHNDMLVATEAETSAIAELFGWFAGLGGEADELYLGGSSRRWPAQIIEAHGLRHTVIAVPSYSLALVRLAESDGKPDAILSANARQQLRRTVREFERYGPLRLTPAATLSEALGFFTEMKELHCRSWDRRGLSHAFAEPFFEQFHRLLLTRTFAAGATQLLRASAGDRVLGYLYNFRFGNRVYAYQSGFAEAGRHEHPGMVSHALAIRHAYRSGARIYDFMAGQNRLKQRFSTHCEPMFWQVIQQPRLVFWLERLGRRLRHLLAGRETHEIPGTTFLAGRH